ncbi:hypothetical protein ACCT28_36340, partial [Rhizobium ruizarguesonis]
HYRQKNPIRKNKTRRKIDGFVSGLSGHSPLFPLRSCRKPGSRSCQFIRGQHRAGKIEGIIPRAPGCN